MGLGPIGNGQGATDGGISQMMEAAKIGNEESAHDLKHSMELMQKQRAAGRFLADAATADKIYKQGAQLAQSNQKRSEKHTEGYLQA